MKKNFFGDIKEKILRANDPDEEYYNEEDYDKAHGWFDSLSKEQQEIEKEKSWHQIFNIEPYDSYWIARGNYVQAIFWELRLENVKNVQYFTAR